MAVELLVCECGKVVTKNIYPKHLNTTIHFKAMNKKKKGRPATTSLWKLDWSQLAELNY